MSDLFYFTKRTNFDGIENWDVSNVKDMSWMFYGNDINGDISNWNVSNVEDMRYMFAYSTFNGDISKWNVSNVRDMSYMFYNSEFNQDISKWDVSNVTNMKYMFSNSGFNQDISSWDITKTHNQNLLLGDKYKFDEPFNKYNVLKQFENSEYNTKRLLYNLLEGHNVFRNKDEIMDILAIQYSTDDDVAINKALDYDLNNLLENRERIREVFFEDETSDLFETHCELIDVLIENDISIENKVVKNNLKVEENKESKNLQKSNSIMIK